MFWIHQDYSTHTYGFSMANEIETHMVSQISPSFFTTKKIKISTGNNFINKIGFIIGYSSVSDLDYALMVLEERRNGSYSD